jgi:hypothetical protein
MGETKILLRNMIDRRVRGENRMLMGVSIKGVTIFAFESVPLPGGNTNAHYQKQVNRSPQSKSNQNIFLHGNENQLQ